MSEKEVKPPVKFEGEIEEIDRRDMAIEQLQDLIAVLAKMATMTLEDMKQPNALTLAQADINEKLARIAVNFANSDFAFTPVDKQKAASLADAIVYQPDQIITQVLDLYLDLQGRLSDESKELDELNKRRIDYDKIIAKRLYETLYEYAASGDENILLEACTLTAAYKWFVEHLSNLPSKKRELLSLCNDVEEFMRKNILKRGEDVDKNQIIMICSVLNDV